MKLPELKSARKLRDAKVIHLFSRQNLHPDDIVSQTGISRSTVYRILNKHSDEIQSNRTHQKNLRIAHLQRLLAEHPDRLGKKGTLDIIRELRLELEGDKSTNINVNAQSNVTVMPSITLPNGEPKEYNIGSRNITENT